MKVFILTEGSRKIGFGHITRCTALYQAFEKKGILPEFIVNGDGSVNELLKGKKHIILNWISNTQKLFERIAGADIVIIDSYLADEKLYKRISSSVRLAVYIDDNKRLNYPRGIVVNGTIYAEELNYPAKRGVSYLLGNRYALLRKNFWNVPTKNVREKIKNILVTFGGDDNKNMTSNILKYLTESYPVLNKIVIIGQGFTNVGEIENVADKKTKLVYHPSAAGMKKSMFKSDVAISAGGQTLFELARTGTPTIAIGVAGNQRNNLRGCKKAGIAEYAGSADDSNIISRTNNILSSVLNTGKRKNMARNGQQKINGKGSINIISGILKYYGVSKT